MKKTMLTHHRRGLTKTPLTEYNLESMKAVAINGSPRKGGNTEILLKQVLAPLASAGWDTEFVQLGGKDIRGCQACYRASALLLSYGTTIIRGFEPNRLTGRTTSLSRVGRIRIARFGL